MPDVVGEEGTNFVSMVSQNECSDDSGGSGAEDVRQKLFDKHFPTRVIFEPEVAKYLTIPFIDMNIMEKTGNIGHKGDGLFAEAGEDVDEGIDEIRTAEQIVVETYAVDVRAGVVAHPYLAVLVHCVHGEVPAGKLGIHFVVGDVDGESFVVEFLHLRENALFVDRVALKSRDH